MIENIQSHWYDLEELQKDLISISTRQLELAGLIAAQDQELNSAFINEKESSFKGTDSMAKARAKSIIGSSKVSYEYEFEALNTLVNIVTSRISLLLTQQLRAQGTLSYGPEAI